MTLTAPSLKESAAINAKALLVSDNRVLCRALGHWKMYADARDISQMPYLAMDGIIEPHLIEHICDLVKPGMTCVDVGACYGFHALLMAELVGRPGAVHAFEPHPRC